MTISIETDNATKRVLAIYLQVEEGEVFRTVEIEQDACYADEDKSGRLLGVEILAPGTLTFLTKKVAEHYSSTEIDELLEQARLALA